MFCSGRISTYVLGTVLVCRSAVMVDGIAYGAVVNLVVVDAWSVTVTKTVVRVEAVTWVVGVGSTVVETVETVETMVLVVVVVE